MNKDQIRHKCGYCGWLFSFTTNFLEHECFKHYVEDEDRIYVDENYVVTIYKTRTVEEPAHKDNLDELLIGAVKARTALYDNSIPAFERSNLRKNALWAEVSNTLGGALTPEEAKARWKYLRDNYIKARKKVKGYIPSGSAAEAANIKKSKFRFYDLMTFLNDVFETRQTVSSLSDNIVENEIYRTEQYEDDTVASSLGSIESTDTSMSSSPIAFPSTLTRVQTPTPTFVTSQTSKSNISQRMPSIVSMTSLKPPTTNSKKSLRITDYDLDISRQNPVTKKQKSDALQVALIEALKEPTTQAADPLDGFLARLGEGMRRLPYRERARLEIQFLTLLAEKEDLCANNDSSSKLSTRY